MFLFTFQFFVTMFGIYRLYSKITASPKEKREKKITTPKLCVLAMLLTVNGFWMYHTYCLISLDAELQRVNWDPFTQLGLPIPTLVTQGFNTPEVKKTYRKLAREYHPDKLARKNLSEVEMQEAEQKWHAIVKGYETLTDSKKF